MNVSENKQDINTTENVNWFLTDVLCAGEFPNHSSKLELTDSCK